MTVKLVEQKQFKHVYILKAPCVYASIIEPKKKYADPLPDAKNQSKREYAITVFVNDEDREELEDKFMLNKQFFEVGKDKTKTRKLKYPVVDADGNDTAYTPYKGMHGVQLTLNELTNAGKPANLNVVKRNEDGKTETCTDLVGNGSIVSVKLFAYANQDKLLNVTLDTVVVEDLVPYEGGSGGVVTDDILGVSIDLDARKQKEVVADEPPFEADNQDDDDF